MSIFKKIFLLYSLYKGSRLIEDAWEELANENYVNASALFDEGEKLLQVMLLHVLIMKCSIKFSNKERQEAINAIKKSWEYIDSSSELKKADKLYLMEYLYSMINVYKPHLDIDYSFCREVHTSDVRYEQVSDYWKNKFPSTRYR